MIPGLVQSLILQKVTGPGTPSVLFHLEPEKGDWQEGWLLSGSSLPKPNLSIWMLNRPCAIWARPPSQCFLTQNNWILRMCYRKELSRCIRLALWLAWKLSGNSIHSPITHRHNLVHLELMINNMSYLGLGKASKELWCFNGSQALQKQTAQGRTGVQRL